MTYQIVPIGSDLEGEWNAFVRRARNGHFMFERSYITYHADRFFEASLVVIERGCIVGVLPANRSGDVVYSHQGLTFGGLLVDEAGSSDVLAMLDACADALRTSGATRLVYKPSPWIYHRRPAQEDLYWLFRRNARLTRRDITSTIRLADPGPVATLRRRGVAKAARANLVFRHSLAFDEYWTLLREVLADRHDVNPTHTAEEIRQLAQAYPDNILLHVAEDPAGEVLAGIVTYRTATVTHAQYIAVGRRGRELGALDGLVSHLLAAASRESLYFDFGISNEDRGRILNVGLIAQKEGFGASAVAHDHYELELG